MAAGLPQLIGMYSKPRFFPIVQYYPQLAAVTPNTGPQTGGTLIRITGTGFDNVASLSVTIGGAPCTGIIAGGGIITCYTPAGAVGGQPLVVTSGAGSGAALTFTYTSVALPPTVSSFNYAQGSPDGGGQTIVITGSGFTGATSVTFGGTSATFSVVNDTTINATLPAHAAGVVSVVVTGSGGPSTQTNNFEYYSPAQLGVNVWVRGSYTAPASDPRWSGTASAGNSGTQPFNRDLSLDAIPTVGTAVGGFTPAAFSSEALDTGSVTMSSIVSSAAGTILMLVNPSSPGSPGANALADPALLCSRDNKLAMGYSTSGFRAGIHDGAAKSTGFIAMSAGNWHAAAMQWDSANVKAQIDGGAVQSAPAGALSTLTAPMEIGKQESIAFTTCSILEVIAIGSASLALTGGDCDKIRAYWRQRYGVSV